MISPRSVIVGLPGARAHRAAIDAGAELARLFGVRVRGFFHEDQTISELCDLPRAFLPASLATRAHVVRRQTVTAAISRETRRTCAELASYARRSRLELEISIAGGSLGEALASSAGPDDILVVPLDLSERPVGRQVQRYAELCRGAGGVLLVPDKHPSRMGRVVAVADAGSNRLLDTASRIAEGLRTALTVAEVVPVPGTRRTGSVSTDRCIRLEGSRKLTASDVPDAGLRLLACERRNLGAIELDGPGSALMRFRAPLLVLSA